jgi:endoglucanase
MTQRRIVSVLATCLALLGLSLAVPLAARGAASDRLPGALHTQDRWIVDGHGNRVKLASVNWSGAETQAFAVGGLDVRKLDALAALIHDGGFNSVRLPWSNQLVEDNPVVPAQYLRANPQLVGMHALDVLDAVISALRRHGVMVVLDNHRSRADWCCDEDHGDGLWYTPQYPETSWLRDWQTMARRYAGARNVVGAELRNEIRPEPQLAPRPTTATWGDGNPLTDWRAAAERGGDAVLSVDPNWLIVVGGTEYQGNLTGVRDAPVELSLPHRVVYAAHDYRWFHPDAELQDYPAFRAQIEQRWGYIATPGKPWSAPVYVSETGTCTNPNVTEQCAPLDPIYLRDISHYLRTKDLDFAYWPFNGTQGTGYNRTYGAPETYGLLAPDWSSYGNQRVLGVLQRLQQPRRGPGTCSERQLVGVHDAQPAAQPRHADDHRRRPGSRIGR